MKNKEYILRQLKLLRHVNTAGIITMKKMINPSSTFPVFSTDEVAEVQSMADWIEEQIKKMEGEGETIYPKTPDEQLLIPGFIEYVPKTKTCTCSMTKLIQEGCKGDCK